MKVVIKESIIYDLIVSFDKKKMYTKKRTLRTSKCESGHPSHKMIDNFCFFLVYFLDFSHLLQ